MKEQERIRIILEKLDRAYGTERKSYLDHENAWQLLVATILSAQCTDARVNLVTKDLFRKYDSLEKLAAAEQKELEQDIYTTGFYHNKAKNLIACAKALLERHGGQVPSDIESLTALPGVGRKTANVVRGNIFGIPSIVVDTHVGRIARRLGLTRQEDPVKVEFELMERIPQDHWILINLHLIALGRSLCKAPRPDCGGCFLKENCPFGKKQLASEPK
ncbi:MAG: endonuclease III [Lachnospiraceae bacterium]|nr:endonuclease III [Lachnospiraceae bacterium]